MGDKIHFKLYKAGKIWLSTAIAVVSFGGFMVVNSASNSIYADTTANTQSVATLSNSASSEEVSTSASDSVVSSADTQTTATSAVRSAPVATQVTYDSVATPASASTQTETPTSINLNTSTDNVTTGSTDQLYASTNPGQVVNQDINWQSSDPSIATVDTNGLVTAIKTGTAVITASTTNSLTDSATINVVDTAVGWTNIGWNIHEGEGIDVGSNLQVAFTLTPTNSTNMSYVFSSSDSSVATVNAAGMITAISVGNFVLNFEILQDGVIDNYVSVDLVVVDPANLITNLRYPDNTSLVTGQSFQYEYEITPASANNYTTTWTSSDPTVATVDNNGVVTALKAGMTTILLTVNQSGNPLYFTGPVVVTVADPVAATGITLNENAVNLAANDTEQLTATITPENATDQDITWTSSDSTVATVSATGLVTAIKEGKAVITAALANGLTATCVVNVYPVLIPLTSVYYPYIPTLQVGQTYQDYYAPTPTDANNTVVTWTSDDSSIATVDVNGLVTAVGVGTTTINMNISQIGTTHFFPVTQTVTVDPAIDVTNVTLNASSAEMMVNGNYQLTATITPSNATIKTVTWTSSDPSIATVDANGLITGLKAGTVTIIATTNNDLTAQANITVADAVSVNDFYFTADSYELKAGSTEQLTSVVDPSSAVFPTIVWMSANQNVVTVDADGNITAQAPGTTTITATLTDTFGNVKTYVHDFTVDLADSSALPSYTTADEVTQILTSTTIQQLLAANGLTYSDLAPFSGKQFTSTTIYYSFNDSLLDLTTSDGQTFTEDQLVAMASDQWNKALASVGSSIVFLPADDEHTANLVFGQKDDSEIPGYAGMTYTNYNLDTMIINDPVNIVLNIDAVNSHYSETAMINVLVHEMGHALGLGHINDNTNVMWYAAADNTLLTVQDSISVLLNYELPSGTTSEATIGVNDYTPTQLAVV